MSFFLNLLRDTVLRVCIGLHITSAGAWRSRVVTHKVATTCEATTAIAVVVVGPAWALVGCELAGGSSNAFFVVQLNLTVTAWSDVCNTAGLWWTTVGVKVHVTHLYREKVKEAQVTARLHRVKNTQHFMFETWTSSLCLTSIVPTNMHAYEALSPTMPLLFIWQWLRQISALELINSTRVTLCSMKHLLPKMFGHIYSLK